MYYIDLGFKTSETDKMFFMGIVLTTIHTNNKFRFALSFPEFKKGLETINKRNWNNDFAKPGKIIRLFSMEKESLEKFLNLQVIKDFKDKNILTYSKPILAPTVNEYEYYIRNQDDAHIRNIQKTIKNKDFKVKDDNGNLIEKDISFFNEKLERNKIKKEKNQVNVFYIKTYSSSKNTNFSLFVERKLSSHKTENFNPSRYGLSSTENITFLPIFESNLDI